MFPLVKLHTRLHNLRHHDYHHPTYTNTVQFESSTAAYDHKETLFSDASNIVFSWQC